jgi:hypothetical protein
MSRSEHAEAFLAAAERSWDLAGSRQVAAAWDDESSCAGMTVGGLTHHLLRQPVHVAEGLRSPPHVDPPIPLLSHYDSAAWVRAAAEDDVNVAIREGGNEGARVGRDVVLEHARVAIDALPDLLAEAREPDTIHIPWQGWSLTTTDFLTTRMMELVVHGDDLASSVGLDTPTYPQAVIEPVLALLTGVSARRHGQAALVRALARPQRAPGSVSAF